jgi:hypothetical protein
MHTSSINNGYFEPVHSAHSIEQVVLVLHFDRPIDQQYLSAALVCAAQFKTLLPGVAPVLGGGIAIAFGGQSIPMQMPPAGVVMSRSAPDGTIENELRIEQASITFKSTRYTRWSDIWGQAEKYYAALIGHYLDSGATLVSISINFVDKFVWNGSAKDFSPNLLLSKDSEFVAKHIFSLEDLWHIHTGAFIKSDAQTKRLMNINIDCLDEMVGLNSRRSISITTVLTDMFNQNGFEPLSLAQDSGEVMNFISAHMGALHAFDKEILGKTLVESMAKQIALIN